MIRKTFNYTFFGFFEVKYIPEVFKEEHGSEFLGALAFLLCQLGFFIIDLLILAIAISVVFNVYLDIFQAFAVMILLHYFRKGSFIKWKVW